MKNPYKKSFYSLLFLVTIFLCSIFAFNRAVDPKAYFTGPRIEGLNVNKMYASRERTILSAKPEVIILGSSRAQVGINALDKAWNKRNVFNLGAGGESIYDNLVFLKYAHQQNPINEVFLMVDLFMFSEARKPYIASEYNFLDSVQQNESLFKSNIVSSLLSFTTLNQSFLTLQNQSLTTDVMNHGAILNHVSVPPGHSKIKSTESAYYKVHFRNFSYRSMLPAFEEILDFVEQHNIILTIGISPIHARLLEVIYISDLWDDFESWKKELTTILDAHNKKNKQSSIILIDFSGYNQFTTEEAPLPNNFRQMQWYEESSHYNHKLGSLIIKRMIDPSNKVADFGKLINVDNINNHLSEIRLHRELWKKEYPLHLKDVHSLKR